MSDLFTLTQSLHARINLSAHNVADAAAALASPEVGEQEKMDFLSALSAKGETAAEVAEFAKNFRARALDPQVGAWSKDAIDIVGTGGDHSGGFNISSLVVFTLASAGVTVMKHGNRGITSKCGSADLMAALGVDLDAKPETLRAALAELGFVYFLATNYHPAFKHIAPVRKALAAKGQRTVFNILGPLINPGRPARIILGVFSPQWVERLAGALDVLGVDSGLAVHGEIADGRGIDELTTATRNHLVGAGKLRDLRETWDGGAAHGFARSDFADLQGGDVTANVAIVEAILAGQGPAGLVDTIVFNAATALWLCGRVPTVADGAGLARELLIGGAVRRKIEDTKTFFQR